MRRVLLIALVCVAYASAVPVPVQKTRTFGNFGPQIPNAFDVFKPSQHSATSSVDAVSAAINFFAANAKVPIESVTVASSHTSKYNGVTHVYLQQIINGLEVSNGVGNVNVAKNGQILSVGKSFYSGPAPVKEDSLQPNLTATAAVLATAKFLNLQHTGSLSSLVESDSLSRIGTPAFTVSGASFAVKEIPAVLKYLQVNGGADLSLVWSLELETQDNMYNAFVDVIDGEVVQLIDWVSDAGYNVFPFGINDPSSGDRRYIQNPADPMASPLGWHAISEGQGSTKTIGNNVIAQENLNGNADYENNYRPEGGASLDFNFPLFLQLDPTEYLDTSITNLFYWNNVIHDLFYNYGFDEAAGNFQETNFLGEGTGGDSVIAHAQDGSGFNNANFATPPDGQKGRMRMYVWTASTPRRDGDLDGGIVMHEYAHGISNRLTGGRTNVGCLGFGEPGGMGEGWGDFFATITRVTESTTRTQNYAMGDYSANDAGGIRNYVYSTNMTTNPSTYNYVVRPGYSGVHAKGEVWAVILYDVFWNMVDAHGFDNNWYNTASTGGNVKMLQLVVDGLKLQPCSPNFVQARDAIIEADDVNNGGANLCTLWRGFAKRGLGSGARFEGVESFDVPTGC